MTVLSIVNRGRKIPCRISNRQSCFILKRTSSVISKRQTASFRNDSFAFDSSIINLNVLSKWQIIYHFEMRSHNLIPIRWVPARSRQRDRERCREPETAPNFVRKICPAGQLSEWWCICKLSFFTPFENFSSEGVVFFFENSYIINRIFICEGGIQRETKPWYDQTGWCFPWRFRQVKHLSSDRCYFLYLSGPVTGLLIS